MSIFDIRGTNGSGKSHIVHELVRLHNGKTLFDDMYHNEYYTRIDLPDGKIIWVLGKYKTQCGGADGIPKQATVLAMIEMLHLATRGFNNQHVILEGSIIATIFTSYHNLAERIGDYHFCFLNTPPEVCVERVLKRRAAKGKTEVFDAEKTLLPRYRSIQRVREKCLLATHHVHDIDHMRPIESFMEVLNGVVSTGRN